MQEARTATPPPSPFASCFQGSENSNDDLPGPNEARADVTEGAPLADRSRSSVSRIIDQLRSVPVEDRGSPTNSPDTPSAAGEQQMLALSRNGSTMSAPLLAELLHCKLLSCKGQASLEEQLSLFNSR